MINVIKKLRSNKLARYIFVGGLSYLLEVGAIYSLILFGVDKLISVAIAFWFGLTISFLLQKIFAFDNKEKTIKKLAWQSVTYGILVVVNYGFTLSFVAVLNSTIGLIVARTIALLITTIWNYFIYKKIIFKVS